MSVKYLEDLEHDVYQAIRTLEGERYYDYTWSLAEIIRQAKHYQRIAESLLAGQVGLKLEINQAEFNRANNERDWFRFPERPQRPCAEIESGEGTDTPEG